MYAVVEGDADNDSSCVCMIGADGRYVKYMCTYQQTAGGAGAGAGAALKVVAGAAAAALATAAATFSGSTKSTTKGGGSVGTQGQKSVQR